MPLAPSLSATAWVQFAGVTPPTAVCAVGRAGATERGLEERLRRDAVDRKWSGSAAATAASQSGNAAAVLQHQIGVGLLELLPAQRHHVRHRVHGRWARTRA